MEHVTNPQGQGKYEKLEKEISRRFKQQTNVEPARE